MVETEKKKLSIFGFKLVFVRKYGITPIVSWINSNILTKNDALLNKNHNSKIVREFCKYVLRGKIYVGFSGSSPYKVFFEEDKDKFKSYPLELVQKDFLEKVTEIEIEE